MAKEQADIYEEERSFTKEDYNATGGDQAMLTVMLSSLTIHSKVHKVLKWG